MEGGGSAPDDTLPFHPLVQNSLKILEPSVVYEHMQYYGTSEVCKNAVPSSPIEKDDPVFRQILESKPQYSKLSEMAQHCSAINDKDRYLKSFKKCDVPNIKPANEELALAVEFTFQMLSYAAGYGSTNKVDYNPQTSNGVPYQRMTNPDTGKLFQNKGELLNSSIAQEELERFYTPVFGVNGKVELLPRKDVEIDKKMRTVFGGDTSFVMKQKIMYDKMDERMIQNSENWYKNWSRYGFVRQYGGFNRLASAHLEQMKRRCDVMNIDYKYIIHETSDASGWDRTLPLMEEVYFIRKKLFGNMSDKEIALHDYITKYICKPFCVTYKGEIYRRLAGNCSGSGKTTTDNTIAHIIIQFYKFICLFKDKHGRLPKYDDIIEAVVNSLYGDDNFTSIIITEWIPESEISDDIDSMIEYYKSRHIAIYKEFNLQVKPSQFAVQSTMEGLEFLGGSLTYSYLYDSWLALPRMSKVASTLTKIIEKDRDVMQYVSIVEAAYSLTWGINSTECKLVQQYLVDLSEYIIRSEMAQDLPTSSIQFLASVVLGTYPGGALVLGYEANATHFSDKSINDDRFFFYEPQSKWEREGFKSEMEKINSDIYYTYQTCIDYKGKVIELCRKYTLLPPNYFYNKSGMDHMPTFICNAAFRGKSYESKGPSKKLAEHQVAFNIYCSLLDFMSSGEIKFVRNDSPVRKITNVTLTPRPKDIYGIPEYTPDEAYFMRNLDAPENYPKLDRGREIYKREPPKEVDVPKIKEEPRRVRPVEVLTREPLRADVPLRRTTQSVDVSHFKQVTERCKVFIESLRQYREDLDSNDIKSLVLNPFFTYFQDTPMSAVKCISKVVTPYSNIESAKAFYDECQDFCGPLPHPDNFITRLVYSMDDNLSAARLATMFKEGSFNPYGNGQTTQYTITQPVIQNVNGVWICSSTCLTPGPITIIGTGSDALTAFDNWLEQVVSKITMWSPTLDIPFLAKLKTLPPPKDTNHPLYYLWHDENAVQGFIQEFMTGGFNPYGNGQPNTLTRGQWIAMNKKNLANKTKAQTETMYQSYITKRRNQLARTKQNIAAESKSQIGTQNKKQKAYVPKTMKTKQSNNMQQTVRDIIKLSMCAKFYAAALACPFWWLDKSCHVKVESLGILPTEQPCIPTNPTVMSRKMNFFLRIVAGVQADGSAFVAFAPKRIANDYSTVFNNTAPLLYSLSASSYAPGFPVLDTGIAWTGGAANLNGDYNSAATIVNALGQGILYRIVGAGLRIRYIGKLLDESGIAHCVIDPDHYSLSGLNINQIGQFETYFNMQVSPDWITLTYTPVAEEEFQYQPDPINNPAANVGRTTAEHFMGIAFSGLPPGDNIAVEVIVHYEALGRPVRGKTQTPSDVVGTGIVLNAVGEAKQLENNDPANTVKSMISKNLPDITMDTVGKGINSLMAFL